MIVMHTDYSIYTIMLIHYNELRHCVFTLLLEYEITFANDECLDTTE
jgi:hypothetical protein